MRQEVPEGDGYVYYEKLNKFLYLTIAKIAKNYKNVRLKNKVWLPFNTKHNVCFAQNYWLTIVQNSREEIFEKKSFDLKLCIFKNSIS